VTNKSISNSLFKRTSILLPLLFLSLALVFTVSVKDVSATPINTIYVNGSGGNDTSDGSTWLLAKKTIKNATGTVNINGTVKIANGQYTGVNNTQITIDKNMNINGQSETGTVINGTGTNWIFHINSGINLTITNLTITNGNSNYGGAIYNDGTLTVDNSTFTNNTATDYGGGGAIVNEGTLNVTDSNFEGNNAGVAGALYNYGGNLNIIDSTFTNNIAQYGGAIINDGTLTVDNSTFTNNTATDYGGAIFNSNSGTATVNFNRIIGNTAGNGGAIYNYVGIVDARYNWWGSNTSPAGEMGGSDVSYDPWIVLTVTANPTTINVGGTSTVTADLLHDSNGVYHDPVNGHVPDGLTVNFSSDTKGTVTPISTITTNGIANTTFKGISLGVSAISTTLDAQTVTTNVNINKISTAIIVDPVSGYKGKTVNLTVHVTDIYGNPVNEGQVQFTVNGIYDGSATVSNGIATLKWQIPTNWKTGNYNITANYQGTINYTASEGTGLLTVNPSAYLYLQITSSNKNPKVGETFTLTYKIGNKGPDNATNVTMSIPLPSGFIVSKITGDGNWTYNKTTHTITWTLTNVPVGDPYLYITGKTTHTGLYVFSSSISSETYNLNSEGVNPITISTTNSTNPITPTNSTTTVKAVTTTIPMQHTGVPIAGLILAILMVFGGSLIPKLKK